jgi:hypothetical protein
MVVWLNAKGWCRESRAIVSVLKLCARMWKYERVVYLKVMDLPGRTERNHGITVI